MTDTDLARKGAVTPPQSGSDLVLAAASLARLAPRSSAPLRILQSQDGCTIGRVKIDEVETFKKRTSQCGKNCTCCSYILSDGVAQCTSTRRGYFPELSSEANCETASVVYLLTCKRCGIQYVGQTCRPLKSRILEHRRSIIKNSLDTYLVKHFNGNDHGVDDMTVLVLETADKDLLLHKESFWISLFNTAYPYGLNDSIAKYGCVSDPGQCPLNKQSQPYFSMPYKVRYRKGKKKGYTGNKVINYDAIAELERLLQSTEYGALNKVVKFLKSQNRKTIGYCREYVAVHDNQLEFSFRLLIMGFVAGYCKESTATKNRITFSKIE